MWRPEDYPIFSSSVVLPVGHPHDYFLITLPPHCHPSDVAAACSLAPSRVHSPLPPCFPLLLALIAGARQAGAKKNLGGAKSILGVKGPERLDGAEAPTGEDDDNEGGEEEKEFVPGEIVYDASD